MDITRGQRLKLVDLGLSEPTFSVSLELNTGSLVVDVACFGLNGAKKIVSDSYATFYNQPATPCGGVKLAGQRQFDFDLSRLPASIESLVITLAIDGAGAMRQLGACAANVLRGSSVVASYSFAGEHFLAERAVMLLEFYRKDGQWRLCAVGQGFNGGLDALVTHFGGVVDEKPASPPPVRSAPAADPPRPTVSPSTTTLENKGEQIVLQKRGRPGHGRIVCTLDWVPRSAEPKRGILGGVFGAGKGATTKFELGCLVELVNGEKGALQTTEKTFGNYDGAPYVQVMGENAAPDAENRKFLHVNGDHLTEIRRLCVYALYDQGAIEWHEARASLAVTVAGHPPVGIRLEQSDNNKAVCAIAMLESQGGHLQITQLAEYFASHKDLDQRYNWGLRW